MTNDIWLLVAALANGIVAGVNLYLAHRNHRGAQDNLKNAVTNQTVAECNVANAAVNAHRAKELAEAWKRFSAAVTAHWLVQKSLNVDPEED